ncbi:uncharacterized protein PV06_09939 [Exophiala oligosperma]|uniref:EGF-like domain-containing protein n=1 Tax=Exophiala oligosperma TaxID=215243 RepID=A0A0D2ACF7_9EURO|nr:uncharacterized protein PV06_09939 [Exophiala oligosperma]KIW37961.1 hypothetical protein PV06_09939 [Exophiala oligosperma]
MSHARLPSQSNRFHYPQYANQQQQQPAADYAHPSQYQQNQQEFPPHPSIRLPANAKLNVRQVPLGVGVSPPPVRFASPQRPPQRPEGSGVLVQDFKFPTAPPVPESSTGNTKQDASQSPGRRYNVHESYMSSVLDDFVTPGTTPGSRSRGFPTPKRYSGSVYAESEALGVDERYDQGITSQNSSRSTSPENSPQIVRQASVGKRAKPAMTTIKNRNSHMGHEIPEEGAGNVTSTTRAAAMNALSAAVAAGITTKPPHFQPESSESRSYTPVRMPFDTSPPASPSADREYLQTPKSLSTIATTKLFEPTPSSSHSRKSTNPLLGLGIEQPSMSDKIPPNRRPPRLDMDAVKEAEQRGSTTSLSDLIRRATRLAANLDRGKTASRLGMLDMWGSSDKLSNANRHSTMSDMISAFPAPAAGGTPTNRKDGGWPLTEKGEVYASTTDLSKDPSRTKRRKCCGLRLPVFFIVLVVGIIVVAAAVLIPIFLIIVPRQHSKDNSCASIHPCENGGTSISSQDTCVCVCSNRFTGSQCETPGDVQDCTTTTLSEGSNQYKNATMGSSVMPSLLQAQSQFNISLNSSTILSLFSSNNLSCTSENSLMNFNSTSQSTKTRRFIMVPGLEPQSNRLASIDDSPAQPVVSKRVEDPRGFQFERRDDSVTVGTSNGIVFQATSATDIGAVPTPSSSDDRGVSTVTSVAESSSPTAAASSRSESSSPSATSSGSASKPTSTVTDKEVDFARVVVLFVLQQSRTLDVAVHAQQKMEDFFQQQTQGNSSTTVDVGEGNQRFSADFDAFSIKLGNGLVVGGTNAD